MNACVRCGGIRFHSWVVYQEHMFKLHGIHVAADIKPAKISTRTKAEIVRDAEVEMDPHLIVPMDARLSDEYASRKAVQR